MKTLNAICHHLSMQCRYAGAVKRFYSVAEHTVHMVRQARADGLDATTQLKMWLHDAPEHTLGDLVWEVKKKPAIAATFAPLELDEIKRICNDLGLPLQIGVQSLQSGIVKQYDKAILAAEGQHVALPVFPGLREQFDRADTLHVCFLKRLRRAAPYGDNMEHWQNAMMEEYEIIAELMV